MFQLTTSRRGRPLYSQYNPIAIYVSTHDLTKRSTFAVPTIPPNTVLFQLTTSRRGRLIPLSSHKSIHGVSTHDLTKRSTSEDISSFISEDVSTHDLTKRSTDGDRDPLLILGSFNSRPHEEVDTFCLLFRDLQKCFNSRPHEEVDRYMPMQNIR